LTASGDDLTETYDPFKVAMRQIAGAFAQLEKARLVGKLRAARIRKRAVVGKCEGRKSYIETHPEAVDLVRKLRRRKPKGGQMSLRDIAAKLAELGFLNERGKQFNPKSVYAML
jgi:DNA invertase Pin-like site-specific DNA recombinase